jgi:hypothetical protein
MIYLDSRYADGTLLKTWNAKKLQYELVVTREWSTYVQSFFIYEWVEGDRLDNLANKYLGNPASWWEILDINPEILNPFYITAGTQLRIPSA